MADNDAFLLTVEQAAKLCQISKGLAYDLIREGRLPHVRLGRVIRVPRFGLEQWIAREAGASAGLPDDVSLARQPSQRH